MSAPDRGELIVYRTEDGQLPKASAVKESLTVQNDGGHRDDAGEIAELARIENNLNGRRTSDESGCNDGLTRRHEDTNER